MKKFLAIAAVLALTACGGNTKLVSVGFACDTYNSSVEVAASLNERGRLRPSDVTLVDSVVSDVAPICESVNRMVDLDTLGVVDRGSAVLLAVLERYEQ